MVLPWSLGQIVGDYFTGLHHDVRDLPAFASQLTRQTLEKERDYAATIGNRSLERGLWSLPHRASLVGRRNHFVAVPKLS